MASIVQPGTKGAQLSCYTAPGVIFESPLALREHYKTDWHRYNLKRKVSGLPPISATSFQKRREAAAKLRERSAVGPIKGTSHLNKSKQSKKQAQKKSAARKSPSAAAAAAVATAATAATAATPAAAAAAAAVEGEGEGESKGGDVTTSEDTPSTDKTEEPVNLESVTATQLRRAANPCFSIFDNDAFDTVEENLEYMYKRYNFQLPDSKVKKKGF